MNPVFDTGRLRCCPLSMDDLEALHRLWVSPGVRRYLFDDEVISRQRVEDEIRTSTRNFETIGCGLWSLFPRAGALEGVASAQLIGFGGFRHFHEPPELQLLYGVCEECWGQGLASEAAAVMVRYGIEHCSLGQVIASADEPNRASIRVMEKLGMQFDRRVTVDGSDTVYYYIDRAHLPTTAPGS